MLMILKSVVCTITMTKLLLHYATGERDPNYVHPVDIPTLLNINEMLRQMSVIYKNKINEYYENNLWDKYKKISNEYERIFVSKNFNNICSIAPVSRSFFKLWEILHDFEKELHLPRKMKVAFLAEGPGGFTEAFIRKRDGFWGDEYYGITLWSANKSIPNWKLKYPQLKICYGKDGSGNLYHLENIEHFADTAGRGQVDFITADGGFDFSSDFNNQEQQSFGLLLCEVTAAILMQSDGGCFLLKVFDCFMHESIVLFQILSIFYKDIYFIKPLTSRPANSERYVLCTGFRKEMVEKQEDMISQLKLCVGKDCDFFKKTFRHIDVETSVVHHMVLYNHYYVMRQIANIQRTINYISFFEGLDKGRFQIMMDAVTEKHIKVCKDWCTKYNIPMKRNWSNSLRTTSADQCTDDANKWQRISYSVKSDKTEKNK